MKKNKIKLTEAQLHQIIKESVRKVLNEYGENWTPEQWANLAGRAYGSRKTGLKSIGNGDYNARKARQAELFANMAREKAIGDDFTTDMQNVPGQKGSANGYKNDYIAPSTNNDVDFRKGNYDSENNQPFIVRRNQFNNVSDKKYGVNDNEKFTTQQLKDYYGENGKEDNLNVRTGNAVNQTKSMNTAFRRGMNDVQGKTEKGVSGTVYDKQHYFGK